MVGSWVVVSLAVVVVEQEEEEEVGVDIVLWGHSACLEQPELALEWFARFRWVKGKLAEKPAQNLWLRSRELVPVARRIQSPASA